jgi:lysophospholipase L1-like esterase
MPRERRSKYANDAKDTVGIASQVESLSSSLAEKANKAEVLQKRDKSTLITMADLGQDVKTGMTGGSVAVVGVDSVLEENIVDKQITPRKTNFMYVSKNLAKWSTRTLDKFVQANAILTDSPNFDVSDFIPVKPNTVYSLSPKFWGAYYDENKNPLAQGYNSPEGSITTPSNCYFIRMTFSKDQQSNMLYEGETLHPYENPDTEFINKPIVNNNSVEDDELSLAKIKSDEIKSFVRSFNNNKISMLSDLKNPYKKTRVVLFGDSITHGVGATGFDTIGDLIGNTGTRRDGVTSASWANLFRNYLNEHYGKEICVSAMYDKNVTRNDAVGPYDEGLAYVQNNLNGIYLTTTFTSDKITVGYLKGDFGMIDVLIDDVLHTTIDCYSSSAGQGESVIIVPQGTHTLKIRGTGQKNASASQVPGVVTYFKLMKTIEIENNGVSGYQSQSISVLVRLLSSTNDDYIIYMAGTNDRNEQTDAYRTYATCQYVNNWLKTNRPNTKLIVMSANPCGIEEYQNSLYKFHMEDVDMALRQATLESDTPFISHYRKLSNYILESENPMTEITDDHIHPNDKGHKMMFEHLIQELGLAVKMNI